VRTVGLFDSGLGGLTVLRRMLPRFPGHRYLYFGDFAHMPYGSREPDEIRTFALNISHFLISEGADILVMACNISSSVALAEARAKFDVPIFGMIEGGVAGALKASRKGRVAVLTTPATARVGAYSRELLRHGLAAREVACPEWVPLIESYFSSPGEREVPPLICSRVREALEFSPDVIILGCTHYPLIEPWIRNCIHPTEIFLVDPATETLNSLSQYLTENSVAPEQPDITFYLSAQPNHFADSVRTILGVQPSRDAVRVLPEPLVFKESYV
jgi:glutamate racemase